jgi:hypothetical protein
MLSRNTRGKDILIVTEDEDYAIGVMWEAICKPN